MNRQYFSEEYDKQNELDTCRFWLMLRLKKGEYFEKRFTIYLNDLKERLLDMNPNLSIVNKEIDNLQLSAYRTISETFFKENKKV